MIGWLGRFGRLGGGGAKSLTTYDLFRKGELGDFFDNSRLDLMWQDAAGTTPAVADGPVSKQIGVCGNLVRYQPTAGNRLTLKYDSAAGRYYLSQEGVTTAHLVTATLDATPYDCVTVWAGARKLSDAATVGTVYEFSANADSNNGTFNLQAPRYNAVANSARLFSKGTAPAVSSFTFDTPSTKVVTVSACISGDKITPYVNGVKGTTTTTDQGTGTYGNYAMYWFTRGGATLPFTGREYAAGVRFSTIPSTERELQFINNWTTIRTPIS